MKVLLLTNKNYSFRAFNVTDFKFRERNLSPLVFTIHRLTVGNLRIEIFNNF